MNQETKEYLQRTDEWYAARKGKVTASEVEKIMHDRKEPMTPEELAEWKTNNPKSRVTTKSVAFNDGSFTYLNHKVMERLMPDEQFKTFVDETYASSKATDWGTMLEAVARSEYEQKMHVKVETSDFVPHPYTELADWAGGSPDGLVIEHSGIIEIKCPYSLEKHLLHLSYENVEQFKEEESQYYWQCVMNTMITDTEYCDFVSYCPWMNKDQQLKVLRVTRNEEDEKLLLERLYLAKAYLEDGVKKITEISTIII